MNQANQSKTKATDVEWHAEFDGELFLEDNLNQVNIDLNVHVGQTNVQYQCNLNVYMRLVSETLSENAL